MVEVPPGGMRSHLRVSWSWASLPFSVLVAGQRYLVYKDTAAVGRRLSLERPLAVEHRPGAVVREFFRALRG